MRVFNSQPHTGSYQDHSTPEEAIAAIEAAGGGLVVLFLRERNLPGCLPEFVDHSCAMWSFRDGIWRAHYIFDGHGAPVCEEKPH